MGLAHARPNNGVCLSWFSPLWLNQSSGFTILYSCMHKIRYFNNVFAQCDLKSDLGACPKTVFGSACLCICSSIISMSVLVKIVAFGPVSCMYCSKVGRGNSERLPFILRPLYQKWLGIIKKILETRHKLHSV